MKTFIFSFKVKPHKENANYHTVKLGTAVVYSVAETIENAEINSRNRLINGLSPSEKWVIVSDCLTSAECIPEHLIDDEINKSLYRKAQKFGLAVLISGVGFGGFSEVDPLTN
jgi:hypothetical protein